MCLISEFNTVTPFRENPGITVFGCVKGHNHIFIASILNIEFNTETKCLLIT